ncbi:MAG: hypothetical protein Q4F80_01470 [bacterium]|nr:hypothetical protein [bacterium]
MEEIFDLIVVGLGPGGLKAVNRGLEENLKIAAFEKKRSGRLLS